MNEICEDVASYLYAEHEFHITCKSFDRNSNDEFPYIATSDAIDTINAKLSNSFNFYDYEIEDVSDDEICVMDLVAKFKEYNKIEMKIKYKKAEKWEGDFKIHDYEDTCIVNCFSAIME